MQPIKIQKKPVVIEAMQFTGNAQEVLAWVEAGFATTDISTTPSNLGVTIYPTSGSIVIKTVDGDIQLVLGDWIIKDENGEFDSCKARKFDNIYEAVTQS